MSAPLELRCPKCGAQPGQRCRTLTTGRTTGTHLARQNSIGYDGRDEQGRQFCRRCQRWKFPAIHSCPGVPQTSMACPPMLNGKAEGHTGTGWAETEAAARGDGG